MSDSNSDTSKTSSFPLLKLPRELRLEIFSYLADFGVVLRSRQDSNLPFVVWWFDGDHRRNLRYNAILYTSRLLYREAFPILRKVRLIVEDCRVITPLAKSMDERSRTVLRSLSLNRVAVKQREIWEEACRELDKFELRDLEISIEGTDEMLRSISRSDEPEGHDGDNTTVDVLPTVRQEPVRSIGWVDNILTIKKLRKLNIRIPEASLLEGEVNQYLSSRMEGVQVGG